MPGFTKVWRDVYSPFSGLGDRTASRELLFESSEAVLELLELVQDQDVGVASVDPDG